MAGFSRQNPVSHRSPPWQKGLARVSSIMVNLYDFSHPTKLPPLVNQPQNGQNHTGCLYILVHAGMSKAGPPAAADNRPQTGHFVQ